MRRPYRYGVRLPGVRIETTPFYDVERDEFETGDPPERSKLIYAEHMNTLAQSGVAGQDHNPDRDVPLIGHANPAHRIRTTTFIPPTRDEVEAVRVKAQAAMVDNFDEMYLATLREIRSQRTT